MTRLVVFIVVSAANLAFSRRFLRDPRTHGFYRFFAFELILVLFLVNLPLWFANASSGRQILSFSLLAASLIPAIGGFSLLIARGRPAGSFEDTRHLVTGGIYRYIRHPMYLSLMLLAAGIFLKDLSVLAAALFAGSLGFLIATALTEEAENRVKFGEEYAAYMKTAKRFIPFLI
ncbi:MAG: methyltransferase family protein [Bryobacteraceae bacterium]